MKHGCRIAAARSSFRRDIVYVLLYYLLGAEVLGVLEFELLGGDDYVEEELVGHPVVASSGGLILRFTFRMS